MLLPLSSGKKSTILFELSICLSQHCYLHFELAATFALTLAAILSAPTPFSLEINSKSTTSYRLLEFSILLFQHLNETSIILWGCFLWSFMRRSRFWSERRLLLSWWFFEFSLKSLNLLQFDLEIIIDNLLFTLDMTDFPRIIFYNFFRLFSLLFKLILGGFV